MAGEYLPVYEGNAGLGLGTTTGGLYDAKNFESAQKAFDNSFTANIDAQNNRVKLLGDTQKTIALLDNEFNVKMWQQKIADRDNAFQQYLKGNAKVDNYLPEDAQILKEARTKYDNAYRDWSKNINDRDAAKKYKQATDDLNDVAARLAVRYTSKLTQEQEAAAKLLPDEKTGLLNNINSWVNAKDKDGKPALPSIYQPYQKYNADAFNKQAVVTTLKMPTKDGLYNIPFSIFDYKATKKNVDDMQNELGIAAVANEWQHKHFDVLTADQQQAMVQSINQAIAEHSINHPEDKVEPVSYTVIGGRLKLLDSPSDYAAKFLLAQNPDKKGQPEPNEFGLKVKTEKETERHNKAVEAIDWAKVGIEKKKAEAQAKLWLSKTTGAKDTKNEALNYATNMYGQLQQLANPKTGVITPDKVNQLTAEQLKYLGFYTEGKTTTKSGGNETTQTGLVPLSIGGVDKDGNKISDLIELDNGVIRVMRNAKYDEKAKMWRGTWDNSRTTTVTNIATNRVNEENKLSAGKEINSYLPIDALGADGEEGSTQSDGGAIDLTGSEDPSTLKVGQVYNLPDVGVVKWDGKNLVKQK